MRHLPFFALCIEMTVCSFLSSSIERQTTDSRLQESCPFGSGLRKFALDFVFVIFFKNAKKNTSGGLILS
jgi:hypothetical protein